MNSREALKQEILQTIKPVVITGEWYKMEAPITSDTIEKALAEHNNVEIPDVGAPIALERPIILDSNHHLRVAKDQIITKTDDNRQCLLHNAHVQDGAQGVTQGPRDTNISVEGGVWIDRKLFKHWVDPEGKIIGSFGVIILSNVDRVWVHDLSAIDSQNYGVQIGDCSNFIVENLHFHNDRMDGVHVNGPASYGTVRHLDATHMGDDMVALNAWDWEQSAITMGTIDHVVVEDIRSTANEIRMLPGQKVYTDGSRVDCDIRDCVLDGISGIYTFKLYGQPNIYNAIDPTYRDVSGAVGEISNVYFHDVSFLKVQKVGLNGLPVTGMFDVCSNCRDIYMEDIHVANTVEECKELDVALVKVGPLSAVWKNGSEDPAKWGEVFDPDAICHATDLYLKNVDFAGEHVTDINLLTKAVRMTLNPDYPNTTPKGGTGYGTIGKVTAE